MLKPTFLRRISPLLLLIASPIAALAYPPLSIVPAGNGAFVLHGDDLSNAAVIDAAITYDPALLANPRIIQGALARGAMTAANVSVPGTVRVSVMGNGIKGSGPIITLQFDTTGDSPGAITSLTGKITDVAGKTVAVAYNAPNSSAAPAEVASGGAGPSDPQAAQTTAPVEASPARSLVAEATAPRILGGTLTLPAEERQAAEKRDEAPMQQPEYRVEADKRQPEPAPSAPAERASQQPQQEEQTAMADPQPVQSVLERFRLFQGERTVQNLTGLFAQRDDAPYRQEPPVVIADGRTSVKVFISQPPGDKAPSFGFNNAEAVSLTVAGGKWLIEAKPEAGAIEASIAMLLNGKIRQYPIAVSPAAKADLDGSGKVTEDDFRLYLKERGTAAVPEFDLNKDGKRDYLDDYIFTSNYLASKDRKADVELKKTAAKP